MMAIKKITYIESWAREQITREIEGRPGEGREDEVKVPREGRLPNQWEDVEETMKELDSGWVANGREDIYRQEEGTEHC